MLLRGVSGAHLSSVFQRPHKASGEEMTKYHSDDYIKFLRSIRPDNMSEYSKQMQRCKFATEVPCVDKVHQTVQLDISSNTVLNLVLLLCS